MRMPSTLRTHAWSLVLVLTLAAPAIAQTETRAELRRQLTEAAAENERLLREIAVLRERLQRLEQRPAEPAPADPETPPDRTAPPAPTAAQPGPADAASPPAPQEQRPIGRGFDTPESLRAALQQLYAKELPELDRWLEPADAPSPAPDRRTLDLDQYRVERWCRQIPRRIRSNVQWVVQMTAPRALGDGQFRSRIQIVDPQTSSPLGEPFVLEIPRRFANEVTESDDSTGLWSLGLSITASPGYDDQRRAPGELDYPPFIGPFAYFSYEITWRDVEPHTPPAGSPAIDAGADPQLRDAMTTPDE